MNSSSLDLSVEQIVKKIYADMLGLKLSEISDNDTLLTLDGDSLDAIEIAMCLEEEFNIELDFVEDDGGMSAEFGNLCIGDLVKGFEGLRSDKAVKIGDLITYKQFLSYVNPVKIVVSESAPEPVAKCCGNCKSDVVDLKPQNHRKHWSQDEEQVLLFNYAQGTSIKMIARAMGRTEVSILQRLTQLGLVTFDRASNAYYTVPALLYKFE